MADNIIAQFSKMASEQEEITLLNTYKGVPLSFSARIINVGFSSIRVCTDTCQTVSMCLERRTFIQSDLFNETYRADVENLDQVDLVTTLGNFSNVKYGIGNRSEIRVQPAENISITVQDQAGMHRFSGIITDLSQAGVGLYLGWRSFIPQIFTPGASMVLTYQLPGIFTKIQTKPLTAQGTGELDRFSSGQTRFTTTPLRDFHSSSAGREIQSSEQVINPIIQVPAQVANISQDNLFNRYRIGLRAMNNVQQENYILKYISQRQSEIIQEIRERYSLMRQNPGKSMLAGPFAQ